MSQPVSLLIRGRWGARKLFFMFVLAGVGWTAIAALTVFPWVRPALRFVWPPATLRVPVDGVARADLRSTWGAPRTGGRSHKGADIFAPRGTKVVAAARGVVWKVGMDRLGGRVVTVLGEGPAFYYYAHLDDWAQGLARGKEVKAGEVLGYVGTSGNAARTPPHLHFGIYRIGLTGVRATDPIPLLARAKDPFAR